MTTLRVDTNLSVTLTFVSLSRRFTRLRIDQLNIGNVDERLFINDATSAIRLGISLLVSLDHPHSLDLDLALGRRNFKHAPPPSFVAPGDYHNLIILLNFRALCSWHILK